MLGFQRFQVFIGLALNGSCVILKIGKRYDHDDGGAFDALQEEKGRPEGLLNEKYGRHVAGPGHTRRLPPEAGSIPDDVSVAQSLTEKDNAR